MTRTLAIFYTLFVGGILCLTLIAPSQAQSKEAVRRTGDVLSFALPLGVAGWEWMMAREQAPHEGLSQFAWSFGTTLLATEALKRTVRSERPDGRDRLSFPSGHASRAFSAAAFVHRRHGWDQAWPLYAAATYVGWTRVDARRHRWADIAGSAALSVGVAWWLVEPARPERPQVQAMATPDGLQLQWRLPLQ